MSKEQNMKYVTVGPAPRAARWQVASREGDVISFQRLEARLADPDAARAEAQALFPDHQVVLPDDADKPWLAKPEPVEQPSADDQVADLLGAGRGLVGSA